MHRVAWVALAFALACDHEQQGTPAPSTSSVVPPLPSATETASASPAAPASASASVTASATATATVTATASATAAAPTSDAGLACGKKPLPDCPLQGWMKKNMTPPMEAKDYQGIADSLTKAASFAPAGYTNWASIAKDGANAARAADLNAVKAACRGCHDQYKNKYRTEMRTRPVP